MAARVVQRQDQLGAVVNGVLEVLVERDGIVRAGVDAQLAEDARAEVVLILGQYFLLLAVFGRDGLAGHLDGAIGASHLAQAAGNAVVFVVLVVGHGQCPAETVEHLQFLPVLGILFRHLFREEFTHGRLQADAQAAHPLHQTIKISIFFFHNSHKLWGLKVQSEGGYQCHEQQVDHRNRY